MWIIQTIFAILALYVAAHGAQSTCCTDGDDGFTCVSTNGTTTQKCNTSLTCDPGDEEFRLAAKVTQFYPYKGEAVRMAANLTSPESITGITVTLDSKQSNSLGTEYVYTIDNIAKANQSQTHQFKALGNQSSKTVCSTLTMEIAYVYTVRISTAQERYVAEIKQDITVNVIVRTEGDWGKITVFETSPGHDQTIISDYVNGSSNQERLFPIAIHTPTKTSEGEYKIEAKETADVDNHNDTETSFRLYVHTTLLSANKTTYIGGLMDDFTLEVQVTTALVSWDDVTINIIKPSGDKEELPLDIPSDHDKPLRLSYHITNAAAKDFGTYAFTATEVAEDFGNTTNQLNITVTDANITSALRNENNVYVVLKGKGGEINCKIAEDTAKWKLGEEDVTENSTKTIHQKLGGDGKAVLVFKEQIDYGMDSNFTCQPDSISSATQVQSSIEVVVHGAPEVTITPNGQNYTCIATGVPIPNITWSLDGKSIEYDDDITTPVQKDGDYDRNSTITISGDRLCLGNQSLVCQSKNEEGPASARTKINQGYNLNIYRERYMIFPSNTKDWTDANSDCTGRLGAFVKIEDDAAKEAVTKFAEENNMTSFFIGAKKNESGEWNWSDGTDVAYPILDTNGESCAVLTKGNDSWSSVGAGKCSEEKNYVCEKTAPSYPKNLQLDASDCQGNVLSATWVVGADSAGQMMEIIKRSSETHIINETLGAENTSYSFYSASPQTSYSVKVSTIPNPRCILKPYAEEQETTGLGSPADAKKVVISGVNDSVCKITWEYGNSSHIDNFIISVTRGINQQNGQAEDTVEIHNVQKDTRIFSIETSPNANYSATVMATSCGGNSTAVLAHGNCLTNVTAPPSLSTPVLTSPAEFSITIPPVDQTFGPISCQFIVVKMLRQDEEVQEMSISEEDFMNIKESNDPVNIGDSFFAYATDRSEETKTLNLGDGSSSFCLPLPVETSRRKRAIDQNQNITALNRPIQEGDRISYYMVTTTPNEENSMVYLANSNYSVIISKPKDPNPPSNNATVIILSILAVIVGTVLIFLVYRRCRRKRKYSNTTLRFSGKIFH